MCRGRRNEGRMRPFLRLELGRKFLNVSSSRRKICCTFICRKVKEDKLSVSSAEPDLQKNTFNLYKYGQFWSWNLLDFSSRMPPQSVDRPW